MYPKLETPPSKLSVGIKRLFIGAYGFEPRSLGWLQYQKQNGKLFERAITIKYSPAKGANKENELKALLKSVGASSIKEIPYNMWNHHSFEGRYFGEVTKLSEKAEEVVIDISAMTKLLILISLYSLSDFPSKVRIVYSEPKDYPPTYEDYVKSKEDMEMLARFPAIGYESAIRAKCLSSIRMLGQPTTMIAFTSFNEQLIRHLLGPISPHRLIMINGVPPRKEHLWRERATEKIHESVINDYLVDNPRDEKGHLKIVASTLNYADTTNVIDQIYQQYGLYERIVCAATGSKMQAVGLFFAKIKHPDMHIEYPTPDSYFEKGLRKPVRQIYELVIDNFASFLKSLRSGS